jgi:hypothetical protein
MDRRQRLQREKDRDARVTVAGFARELVRTAFDTLETAALGDATPDVPGLLTKIEALTGQYRQLQRDLDNARQRRADKADDAAAGPVTPRSFAHVGHYFGAYPDLETFARDAAASLGNDPWAGALHGPPRTDLRALAIDLHVRGEFWTIELDGVVHAFSLDPPGRDEDAERARELLRDELPAEEVEAAMRTYAGRFTTLPEFARWYTWRMRIPSWVLAHVDFWRLSDEWVGRRWIWTVDDVESGLHVFVRREPSLDWP